MYMCINNVYINMYTLLIFSTFYRLRNAIVQSRIIIWTIIIVSFIVTIICLMKFKSIVCSKVKAQS